MQEKKTLKDVCPEKLQLKKKNCMKLYFVRDLKTNLIKSFVNVSI